MSAAYEQSDAPQYYDFEPREAVEAEGGIYLTPGKPADDWFDTHGPSGQHFNIIGSHA